MRVLLTGGTGFIGRRLGIEIVRQGHEVVVLVRERQELPYPASIARWRDSSPLPPVDAVIHLAGENIAAKRWSQERKREILRSRAGTTDRLLARLKGQKLRVFVSASAIGYFGDRGDDWLDDDSGPGQDFLAEVCRAWEQETARASAIAGRTLSLRFGMVLGRHGGALEKILPMFRRGLGGKLGNGRQWLSWIHLDDLVKLLVAALENEAMRGAINAVAPEPVRNGDFTRALGKALGVPVLFAVPRLALRLALGEMSTLLLASQRVSNRRLQELGFRYQFPTLARALESVVCHAMRNRGALCHEFVSEQWLPCPAEELFSFCTDIRNLEKVLPPWLQLETARQSARPLGEGSAVDCRFRVHGIPLRWRSHILQWKQNQEFAHTQQKGPFHFWLHRHSFERLGGGTLLRDQLVYRVPGAYIGDLLIGWKVERDLEALFQYRREALKKAILKDPRSG